jgi:hypothetical protein
MPVPLDGFLEGDTIGLLILADDGDTLEALAQKLQASGGGRETGRFRLASFFLGEQVRDA